MQVLLAQVLLALPAERGVNITQHDSGATPNDLYKAFSWDTLATGWSLSEHPDEGYVDLAGSTIKIMAVLREEQTSGSLPITGMLN